MLDMDEDFIFEIEVVQNVKGIELSLMGEVYVDENGDSVLMQLDDCCNNKNLVKEAKETLRELAFEKFEFKDTSTVYSLNL